MLRRPIEPGQYLAIRYTDRLIEAGIEPSVGSTGDSYDNALAESVIGLFKTEVIRRRGPWKGIEDVEFATLTWVAWYNRSRLLEPLGYVPPTEFEEAYYRDRGVAAEKRLPHLPQDRDLTCSMTPRSGVQEGGSAIHAVTDGSSNPFVHGSTEVQTFT